ncbi:MAG: tail fiber domain-containing protein [Deltaproteobacteria bacterium]|nr:tail fiber domain-containing protein [Deltaproteobacteria bacterium]
MCVGFDCVNGESFSFDTIRLKENNLRIHFNDTSNSGSFPTRDWRIIINDSNNGGASYFAIEDSDAARKVFLITGGAPADSLFIGASGNVGLGTSTPDTELHIKDSDTPTVRLEQDSSGGWTAQTWDIAANESSFFIRDITNGSIRPFTIQPATPAGTLCLKADGKVGIGTSSPAHILDVAGDVRATGGFIAGSSRDLKMEIEELSSTDAVKAIQDLEPVTYKYKADSKEQHVGFIAEDVPDLVAINGRKGLSSMDIVAVLTKVVKEQQKLIEEQGKNLRHFERRLNDMESRIYPDF